MKNNNRVPKKQWNKWSEAAHRTFNQVYESVRDGYKVLFPPAAQSLTKATIDVIAWNTAWVAADACDGVD